VTAQSRSEAFLDIDAEIDAPDKRQNGAT